MKEIRYLEALERATAQLSGRGAFLCVGGARDNVMTIGWGSIGFYWGKPVFVVPVRDSRFTHPLMRAAEAFTVCVPLDGALDEALKICGTASGRDGDKFEGAGLVKERAQAVDAPAVRVSGLRFECVKRLELPIDPAGLDAQIDARMYPLKDYHTLFFGEIVRCLEA